MVTKKVVKEKNSIKFIYVVAVFIFKSALVFVLLTSVSSEACNLVNY